MRAIVTVGVPASGKSTFAKEMELEGYQDINRDFIRFEFVAPGKNWSNYKFSKANGLHYRHLLRSRWNLFRRYNRMA